MNKTIIVSNRLPVDLRFKDNKLHVKSSIGGLATGMKSIHSEGNGIWIGWSGLTEEDIRLGQNDIVDGALKKEKCIRVPLTADDIEKYYYGFSNKALWPLFHYFQEYSEFELEQWESYISVNKKFANVVLEHATDGDTIWVHDYQLLLLPKLLKESNPKLTIGFFLHIPYPSYEIFRTFPWREELLRGMLGADLIGFHTYDYVRHFLSSVSRIQGFEVKLNAISYDDRIVKVDSFPMGIDYKRYNGTALEHSQRPDDRKSDIMLKLEEHNLNFSDSKIILSIDRMDYTKGIPNRIKTFEYFLKKYPEFNEKVRLVMLAVPSRENVGQYQKLKRETDELVGRINGQFATVNWTPIWYFYRSMPFDDLIDLYCCADIALITPLRDGMNLVAKEYVATRINDDGVLVLSEMAGAAKEMPEAIVVNPYNFEQVAESIALAIGMDKDEQCTRMKALKNRVARYNVEKWADDFLKSLEATKDIEDLNVSKKLTQAFIESMQIRFRSSKKRLFLLDYDGTLVGFKNTPAEASPDPDLLMLLDRLAADATSEVAIISGRDRETLEGWLGHKNYTLITDHGVWMKNRTKEWRALERLKNDWKQSIRPILESFADRTPGAFVEEKKYSLAWHYRRSDTELANLRAMELKLVLNSLITNNSLAVLEGNKVLEIKSSNVNKGRAASALLLDEAYDFILAIGDDWTDEYMFEELPDDVFTVKVGNQKTAARYFVKDVTQVRSVLAAF